MVTTKHRFTKTLTLCFTILLFGCVTFLNAQTNFANLGNPDSGGTGFRTMANNSNLVVSNVMVNDGTEMYTSTEHSSFTIKAFGVDDFTFEEMTIRAYMSEIVDASSTVVFKDKNGDTLQTMTLIANKTLTTSNTALTSFFDNGTSTPINNVAEIVFDLKSPVQHYTTNYQYADITISGSLIAQTNDFANLGNLNSGGTGFKTMANNSNLVVSNVMENYGTEMSTSTEHSSFTIKAFGVDDFTFEEMTIRAYMTEIVEASSTVVFKDKNGATLQTMTLIANKTLTMDRTALTSFFDNGASIPINNVAEIVFDLKSPVQHYTTNYHYVDITISGIGGATPIELSSFVANTDAGVVKLSWETASETNNASFVVYRNNVLLTKVEGAGTTSATNNYTYTDATVIPGVEYTYVLADVDYENNETKYESKAVVVTVDNDVEDASFEIGTAYPNPFNPSTVVPVELSRDAIVNAKIYTLNGREIATLVNGTMNAGSHELRINASNMTTGLYLVKVMVEDVVNVQKIAFVK